MSNQDTGQLGEIFINDPFPFGIVQEIIKMKEGMIPIKNNRQLQMKLLTRVDSCQDDVFDVAKKLSKHGFVLRVYFPENEIYVIGVDFNKIDFNEIKRISKVNDSCLEYLSKNLIKIKL